MKKLILGCLLAVSSISLFGQKVNVLKPDITKAVYASSIASSCLESADNKLYFYHADDKLLLPVDKPVKDVIYVINKNNYSVSEIQLQRSNLHKFVAMYEDDNNLYAIYKEWQKKTNVYTFYLNVINKNQTVAKWKPKKILTFPSDKKDKDFFNFALSPDKRKLAIWMLVESKKNKNITSVAMAFGEGGEKLWKNDMNLDFSNKIFSILDMKLDNEATLYAAISSYSNVTKTTRKEESLHIMIVSSDNSQTYSESVDFGYVASSVVGLSKTGKVILGGFYRKDLSKNLVGSYMSILDPQREELTFDTIGFPKDYYSGKGMSGFMSRIPAASAYETNADCIMEYDDGSLLLLGEMRTYIQYHDPKGGSYWNFFARNIPAIFADSNGHIVNFETINKNQMCVMTFFPTTHFLKAVGFSYTPIMYNNKVHLFFCDVADNYRGKSNLVSKGSFSPIHATVHCTLEQGQPIKSEIILDGKADKYRMVIPLFMKDDAVIGIGTNKKKKGEIVEIKHSF